MKRAFLLLLAVVALAGCTAEASSTSSSIATVSGERIAPLSREELQGAYRALATLPTRPGWNRAVVVEEHLDGYDSWWRVIGDTGVAVLIPGTNCSDDGALLGGKLAPGDGILWSTKGHDGKVCYNEVEVTRLGATEVSK